MRIEKLRKVAVRIQGQVRRSRIQILSRHFFLRLFQNDFISFEDQMMGKVFGFLALIAVFMAQMAKIMLSKYLIYPDYGTSWVEKFHFISILMIMIGICTSIQWENMFPDRTDYLNLMILPLKPKTVYTAKFISLTLFVGMFAFCANTVSVLVFSFYLPCWQSSSALFTLKFAAVHLLSCLCACFFMYFFIVLLIGLLMNLFGDRIYRLLAINFRLILLTLFIFGIIAVVTDMVSVSRFLNSLAGSRAEDPSLLFLLPPMWFVGLYESLLGNSDPVFAALGKYAVAAIIISAAAFFLVSLLSYRRFMKNIAVGDSRGVSGFRRFISRLEDMAALGIFQPVQRAVSQFFGKTFRRSSLHKSRLGLFMAAAGGIIMILLVRRSLSGQGFRYLDTSLLAAPFILGFFLVVGLSRIVEIPNSLPSNWIFPLTEDDVKRNYPQGMRLGIIFYILIPFSAFVFLFSTFLWGWGTAILHAFFGLSIYLVLMEALFLRFRKIPFACSYLPGKEKIYWYWLAYFFIVLMVVFMIPRWERYLLEHRKVLVLFFGFMAALYFGLLTYRRFVGERRMVLIYEEEPPPVMITLDLRN